MKFKTADILSAATGILYGKIDGVYQILNYMTGDNLFTHQLPRAGRFCAPYLKKQLPWLDNIPQGEIPCEHVSMRLARIEAEHGAEHEVEKLPDGHWEHIHPFVELDNMMNAKKEGGNND